MSYASKIDDQPLVSRKTKVLALLLGVPILLAAVMSLTGNAQTPPQLYGAELYSQFRSHGATCDVYRIYAGAAKGFVFAMHCSDGSASITGPR